jgi:predicted Zn-dependent protease
MDVKLPQIIGAQKYEEASAILNRVAWVGRDDSTHRTTLFENAVRQRDFPLAKEQARRLIVLRPTPLAYGSLAQLLEHEGDWEGALEQYQAGRRTDPEHPSLMLGAAIALLELERPEEALTYLEPLAVQFPEDAGTLAGLERARAMRDNASAR